MRKPTKSILFAAVVLASASAIAAEGGDMKPDAAKPHETQPMMHGGNGSGGMMDMMQRMQAMMAHCDDMMAMMRDHGKSMPPRPETPGQDG